MGEKKEVEISSSPRILVDTDWIIDALNGVPAAIQAINGHRMMGVGLSIVSMEELYDGAVQGLDSGLRLAAIRSYLSRFIVINLSDDIMERFALLRSNLRQTGQLIPDFDLVIAATALVLDQTLMTRNRRHFGRIVGLKIFRAET